MVKDLGLKRKHFFMTTYNGFFSFINSVLAAASQTYVSDRVFLSSQCMQTLYEKQQRYLKIFRTVHRDLLLTL
jgi:hypothetical protein